MAERLVKFFALLSILLARSHCSPISFAEYNEENVYPVRLHASRLKDDLSTKNENSYESTASYNIISRDATYIVDLQLKSDKIHTGSILINDYANNRKVKKHVPDHCFYDGKIRGMGDSHVHLSTCSGGLHGSLDTGVEVFDIFPTEEGNRHRLKRSKDIRKDLLKMVEIEEEKETANDAEFKKKDENERMLRKGKDKRKDLPKMGGIKEVKETINDAEFKKNDEILTSTISELVNVEEVYLKYLNTPKAQYVETAIVVDPVILEKTGNNETELILQILNSFSQIDTAYQAINVRIVVVAIDILKEDPWPRDWEKAGNDLSNFKSYVKTTVMQEKFKGVNIDAAFYLSHAGWSNAWGMAYVGVMCHPNNAFSAASVNGWDVNSYHGNVVTLGHEFGHNMGFAHDTSECTCLTRRGCFMGGSKSSRPSFTDCNMEVFKTTNYFCFSNEPTNGLTKVCGNGIVEGDEECDCGTVEMCQRKGDHCCQPRHCTLKKHAQCSHFNNPECCSPQCTFKMQGTMCRESKGDCDIAEYCNGKTALCPSDIVIRNGSPCTNDGQTSGCFSGTCAPTLTSQCQHFWHSDLPGYKIGPHGILYKHHATASKYWNAYDICAKEGALISIDDSDEEHAYLMSFGSDLWLNAYKNEGIWVWGPDGSAINKTRWHPGQPNNYGGYQNCMQIWNGNLWDDLSCNSERPFVCRKDPSRPTYTLHTKSLNFTEALKVCLNEGAALTKDESDAEHTYLTYFGIDMWLAGNRQDDATTWLWSDGTEMAETRWHSGQPNNYGGHQYCMQIWNDGLWDDLPCGSERPFVCKKETTRKAHKICWEKYNTNDEGYGTCSPTDTVPCLEEDVMCGQLQCDTRHEKVAEYFVQQFQSKIVKEEPFTNHTCSLANIVGQEQVGLGMVKDGTHCQNDKMCVDQKCVPVNKCPLGTNGLECSGKGSCSQDLTCVCEPTFAPATHCETTSTPVAGGWSMWSDFDACTLACGDGGTQTRFRHCNNPVPMHGGADCPGEVQETTPCNTEKCPKTTSCELLRQTLSRADITPVDGVYPIKTHDGATINVYCDMTSHGGGWTLIVSSHSNSWTAENVKSRNEDQPSLMKDYSILRYANQLKSSIQPKHASFEYMLEANERGRWGGIFESSTEANLMATKVQDFRVKVVKQFDEYKFSTSSISLNVPFLWGAVVTTDPTPDAYSYGSITGNTHGYHPSRWIKDGHYTLYEPQHIWYWVREKYVMPKSCKGYINAQTLGTLTSGVYAIEQNPQTPAVKTYCDFNRYGGGWTLLTNVITDEWDEEKAKWHATDNVLTQDFSILNLAHLLKELELHEESYQLMVEGADSAVTVENKGAIFQVPRASEVTSCSNAPPVMLKKIGGWKETEENLGKYMPCVGSHKGAHIFANSMVSGDEFGVLAGKGKYMTVMENPANVKIWLREGGSRRSCNDIRVHGVDSVDYADDVYLLRDNMWVYCDMTTTPKQGWTLIMTSATEGWTIDMMESHNPNKPTLLENYSILNKADAIASLSGGAYFHYMLDADRRGQWGGIWMTPTQNKLLSYFKVKPSYLVEKFSDYDYNGQNNPNNYVPYIVNTTGNAFISCNKRDDHHYGVLANTHSWKGYYTNTNRNTQWIYGEKRSPKAIWYWINENDCDEDRQKVNGGMSAWSSWSECSVFCGAGTQERERACNNPKPRCGGVQCPEITRVEERPCQGACLTSKVMTQSSQYCLEPRSGGCNPDYGTLIVLRPTSLHCQTNVSDFAFDPTSGRMWHRCSGKDVCTESASSYVRLAIRTLEDCAQIKSQNARIQRSIIGNIHVGTQCFDTPGGKFANDKYIDLYGVCTDPNKTYFMDSIEGAVKMSIFEDLADPSNNGFMNDPRYPDSPTTDGVIDNLDIPSYTKYQMGYRLTTYYTASHHGYHRFNVACDNYCRLLFTQTPEDHTNLKTIIDLDTWTYRYQWNDKVEQYSEPILMEVGVQYYLEFLVVNNGGTMAGNVRVELPSGEFKLVTRERLSAKLNQS